jgi:putative endonuclease
MYAWIYILSNRPNGSLYVGVTTDLPKRVWEHKSGTIAGFTKRYGIGNLVYFEGHDDIAAAIQREKTIKAWRRAWKVRLIVKDNPDWADLSETLMT